MGIVGQVGAIDVDAISGELLIATEQKTIIEQQAQTLVRTLPPFQPQFTVPNAYQPRPEQRAPQLTLNDADELIVISALQN